MFDSKKPTAMMLGRWQPWHKGHTELFKRAIVKTGQVCIMIRDVQAVSYTHLTLPTICTV